MERNKGITLIALVVTIIILLILAGISINLILGDNGIIGKAIEARDKYAKSEEEEEEALNELSNILAGKVDDNTPGDITDGGKQDGSKEKPYKIRSVEDFLEMIKISRQNGVYNKYVDLECDLDFANPSSYHNPNDTKIFGDYNEDGKTDGIMQELINKNARGLKSGFEFKGVLDGKGYTISNIFMKGNLIYNSENPIDYNFAIFYENTGIIKNLNVQGDIDVTIDDDSKAAKVGGLVAKNKKEGKLINCVSKMNINVVGNNIKLYGSTNIEVGGLVASNESNALIDKCIYKGNIEANFNINSSYDAAYYHNIRIGGIIGNNEAVATNLINEGRISTSKSFSTTVSDTDNKMDTGGIAGKNNETGIIENCINIGKVSSSSETSELFVGGIIASSEKTAILKNAYNEGEVVANTTNNIVIAGILADGYGTIDTTFNKGRLTATSDSGTIKKGAIIGDYHTDGSNISNCYYHKIDEIFGAEGQEKENINPVENLNQAQVIQQLNEKVDENNQIENNRTWYKIIIKNGSLEF